MLAKPLILLTGGSAWESNPPNEVLARYIGFEVENHPFLKINKKQRVELCLGFQSVISVLPILGGSRGKVGSQCNQECN